MKITNTLDALLRLVLTTDEEEQVSEKASPGHDRKHRAQAADRGPERELPAWVRRVNESSSLDPGQVDASAAGVVEQRDVEPAESTVLARAMRWVKSSEAAEPEVVESPAVEREPVDPEPVAVAPLAVEEPVVELAPVHSDPVVVEEPVAEVAAVDSDPVVVEEPVAEVAADPEPVIAEEPAVEVVAADPEPVAPDEPDVVDVPGIDPVDVQAVSSPPMSFERDLHLEAAAHVSHPAPVAETVVEEEPVAVEPDPEPPVVAEAEVAADESADVDVAETAGAGVAVMQVDPDFAHLETAANVAETLNLGFHLGSAVERIAAASNQGSDGVIALREAAWLIQRYVEILERRPIGADLHLSAARLAQAGDAIAGLKAFAEALSAESAPADPEPSAAAPADTAVEPDPEPDSWGAGRIRRLSPDHPA